MALIYEANAHAEHKIYHDTPSMTWHSRPADWEKDFQVRVVCPEIIDLSVVGILMMEQM